MLNNALAEPQIEPSASHDDSCRELMEHRLLQALSPRELEANAVEVAGTRNVIIRLPYGMADADMLESDALNDRLGRLRQQEYFVWTQRHDAGWSVHVSWSETVTPEMQRSA